MTAVTEYCINSSATNMIIVILVWQVLFSAGNIRCSKNNLTNLQMHRAALKADTSTNYVSLSFNFYQSLSVGDFPSEKLIRSTGREVNRR